MRALIYIPVRERALIYIPVRERALIYITVRERALIHIPVRERALVNIPVRVRALIYIPVRVRALIYIDRSEPTNNFNDLSIRQIRRHLNIKLYFIFLFNLGMSTLGPPPGSFSLPPGALPPPGSLAGPGGGPLGPYRSIYEDMMDREIQKGLDYQRLVD